ncbi:hypothetical protein B0T13DRAFT_297454 [Neurospora crassa]|nr:hypothetical protein B0T13DRAFT_297454 [Neurospora crassa]
MVPKRAATAVMCDVSRSTLSSCTEFDTVITAENKGLDRRRQSELSEKETNTTSASLPDGAVTIVGCTGVTSLSGSFPSLLLFWLVGERSHQGSLLRGDVCDTSCLYLLQHQSGFFSKALPSSIVVCSFTILAFFPEFLFAG